MGRGWLVTLLLLGLDAESHAQDAKGGTSPVERAGYAASAFARIDEDIIWSEGYLVAHPDQRFRERGQRARAGRRYDQALHDFRKAASFADKLSQGAIAEMYWNGEGVAVNRPLAYAWMDLAAERGAPLLLAHREQYWASLAPTERAAAVRLGEELYAEFGDAVSKPRLERKLWAARRKVTGSRVGWVGNLSICLRDGDKCRSTVSGDQYYADKYWKPKVYWAWQDKVLNVPPREGNVEVGPAEPVGRERSGE